MSPDRLFCLRCDQRDGIEGGGGRFMRCITPSIVKEVFFLFDAQKHRAR